MNHPWQQPMQPMEIHPNIDQNDNWYRVLFIRVRHASGGWEVVTVGGHNWNDDTALIRVVPR